VRLAAQKMGASLADPAVAAIAADVDGSLVRYLDLVDTGAQMVAPGVFGLSSQLALLNGTWLEEQGLDSLGKAQLQMDRFREGMALVRRLLERLVMRRIGRELAADKVRTAPRLLGGRVLHLAEGGMPWTDIVVSEMPDVLFVIYPEDDEGGRRHVIRTVPAEAGSFASRLDLPAAWAGLRDAQLAAASGVPDATFTHSNLFIGVARSFEGALRMAELALAAQSA
jgi:uncharacterized UPF0160 family protein